MKVSSPVFREGGMIPEKYTCDGKNINPPLEIADVPDGAESLVFILHDPDSQAEDGWTHWLLFDIDPLTDDIMEDSVPLGAVEGITSFGRIGYGGPCPPGETHHYEFRLYALDTELSLDETASRSDIEEAMEDHVIEEALLVGMYGR